MVISYQNSQKQRPRPWTLWPPGGADNHFPSHTHTYLGHNVDSSPLPHLFLNLGINLILPLKNCFLLLFTSVGLSGVTYWSRKVSWSRTLDRAEIQSELEQVWRDTSTGHQWSCLCSGCRASCPSPACLAQRWIAFADRQAPLWSCLGEAFCSLKWGSRSTRTL